MGSYRVNADFIELKERLIESLFKIKHLSSIYHMDMDSQMARSGISIAELTLMKTIKNNAPDSDHNLIISDIQKHLYTSAAAVSKMLGVLEKKGYIVREINRQNRRTLIITLTAEGKEMLNRLEAESGGKLMEIILRLGEKEAEQLIQSIDMFVDATNNVIK